MKNEAYKKLTAEFKKDLSEKLAAPAFADFLTKTKAAADQDSGSFKVVVSTDDRDRQGESVLQSGWDLSFFKLNPVVLWAHDYSALPVGTCTSIEVIDGKLVAEGKFAPADANPFGQQVRRLYELGMVNTTSVGFIPKEFDANNDEIITKAELLEFSFVPVPANPYALSVRQVKDLGIDVPMFKTKGMSIDIKEAPAADDDVAAKMDAAVNSYKEACMKSQKEHSDNHTKNLGDLKTAIEAAMNDKDADPAVGMTKAFAAHTEKTDLENQTHSKAMDTNCESFLKSIADLLKDFSAGDPAGDDAGGNPTADSVRMAHAVKDALTHLTSALTALKDFAGSEGGKGIAPIDGQGENGDRSKSSQDDQGDDVDVMSFIRNRELVRSLNIALGMVLRNYNRRDRSRAKK